MGQTKTEFTDHQILQDKLAAELKELDDELHRSVGRSVSRHIALREGLAAIVSLIPPETDFHTGFDTIYVLSKDRALFALLAAVLHTPLIEQILPNGKLRYDIKLSKELFAPRISSEEHDRDYQLELPFPAVPQ